MICGRLFRPGRLPCDRCSLNQDSVNPPSESGMGHDPLGKGGLDGKVVSGDKHEVMAMMGSNVRLIQIAFLVCMAYFR